MLSVYWTGRSPQDRMYAIRQAVSTCQLTHSRSLLGTFLPCYMMSLGNVLQLLKEALPSMISTPPLMTSPEIFLKGKQHFEVSYRSRHISRISRDVQSKVMQRIYNRTTPEEQKWIVRIILKGEAPLLPRVLLKGLIGQHLRSRYLSEGDHRVLGLSSRRP
jgi:DNA ligase N terminus